MSVGHWAFSQRRFVYFMCPAKRPDKQVGSSGVIEKVINEMQYFKRSTFLKTARPFRMSWLQERLPGKQTCGAALSISFMSLIILRLQSTECAPRAYLISFQDPHSSRGEICQGSRFEKLFRHNLSCALAASFKEGHRQTRNIFHALFAGKMRRSIYHSFCFFPCSGLKEETAHAAHVAFRILSRTQGKRKSAGSMTCDASRVSGRRAEN